MKIVMTFDINLIKVGNQKLSLPLSLPQKKIKKTQKRSINQLEFQNPLKKYNNESREEIEMRKDSINLKKYLSDYQIESPKNFYYQSKLVIGLSETLEFFSIKRVWVQKIFQRNPVISVDDL